MRNFIIKTASVVLLLLTTAGCATTQLPSGDWLNNAQKIDEENNRNK